MSREHNHGIYRVERLDGNIGYINIDRFFPVSPEAEATVAAAMALLTNSNALIVDLRDCRGGDPAMVRLMSSYFFGSKPVHLNSLYDRRTGATEEFWTLAEIQGQRIGNKPVYVLTSGRTFSAAEEFAYNLQALKRGVVVGGNTGGGAHPVEGMPLSDAMVVMMPVARAINPITGTNWEGTGVRPDVAIDEGAALDKAHELALESISTQLDPPEKARAEWLIAGLKAKNDRQELPVERLQEFAGDYGNRKITLAEGKLLYERPEIGTRLFLLPMGGDLFAAEGKTDFRIRFERDAQGRVDALTGLYLHGHSDRSPRAH